MTDFCEIDFIAVETRDSGDAICVRYSRNGVTSIHVVDGGYIDTGNSIISHIHRYYGNPSVIDHVILTHPDGDHAGGLRTVLETMGVRNLWMLRPWLYAQQLLPRFANISSVDHLRRRLRETFTHVVALEEIALRRGIPIHEPFQGTQIGAFLVLSPSSARYLDFVASADRTPEASPATRRLARALVPPGPIATLIDRLRRTLWNTEIFSPESTSWENEMSVVQIAGLCDKRVLLTGDAGRIALKDAADYFEFLGGRLPGIDVFQVPHHGSRRNVSTELLDRWLGPRLSAQLPAGSEKFVAFISSAKADPDHPRRSVRRAIIHRGGAVLATEGTTKGYSQGTWKNDWVQIAGDPYPDDQDE